MLNPTAKSDDHSGRVASAEEDRLVMTSEICQRASSAHRSRCQEIRISANLANDLFVNLPFYHHLCRTSLIVPTAFEAFGTHPRNLLAFGRKSVFSSTVLQHPHCALIKIILRRYCCGICVLHSHRQPAATPDHMVVLRNL